VFRLLSLRHADTASILPAGLSGVSTDPSEALHVGCSPRSWVNVSGSCDASSFGLARRETNSSCCRAESEAAEPNPGKIDPLSWFESSSSTRRLLNRRNASAGIVPWRLLRLRLSSSSGKAE
jgi:hypothetical protein